MERAKRRRIDYEFMVLAPLLVLLLAVNLSDLMAHWEAKDSSAVAMLQMTLTSTFYLLLVVLLILRRPAKLTTRSWVATIAAYVGSFLPFAMVLNGGPTISSPTLTLVSIAFMVLGLGFSLYALSWLGRSFGAVPAARRLVRTGPYRVVRHPLYAGEMVTFIGVVIGELTAFSVMVLFAMVAVQFYRALQEEKVLTEAFPDYEDYSQDTRRFIPGLI